MEEDHVHGLSPARSERAILAWASLAQTSPICNHQEMLEPSASLILSGAALSPTQARLLVHGLHEAEPAQRFLRGASGRVKLRGDWNLLKFGDMAETKVVCQRCVILRIWESRLPTLYGEDRSHDMYLTR